MYDNITLNGEPYVSMNGEIICDEYLPENNPVNSESSFGWFIYMIIGGGFDDMDEMTNQFLNDMDIMSARPEILDRFYGRIYGLPRPAIVDGEDTRYLTDSEYAVYLYLCNCQLLTRLDLLTCFSHCMGSDSTDDLYNGVTVTDESNNVWYTVDHLHYNSPDTPQSNIGRADNTDRDYITDHLTDADDTYLIPDEYSFTGDTVTYVNVPTAGWSSAFLDFLTDYISIKGNVLIREVTV